MIFTNSNIILLTLITVFALLTVYFIFKKDVDIEEENIEEDLYSLSYLSKGIRILFNDILNQNINELYLSKKETQKREKQKARLNQALRSCAQGNLGEKEFVKDYIKELLQNHLSINEVTIDRVIPFNNKGKLTIQDKFEVLLYQYKKKYNYDAFERLSSKCGFEEEKTNEYGVHYEVTSQDINRFYNSYVGTLSFVDKLEILTQRIYQDTYGFSVADEIRDMKIDGISGGVSGVSTRQYNYLEEILQSDDITQSKTFDSMWVFLHGKPIHLSFLSFKTMSELIRVCKNLYRYDNVGHLTSSNGYKLNYLQDGSRVVVVRPKLTSGWGFFVRKFDSAKQMPISDLLTDEGNEKVIELVKWGVNGLLNIVLSGDQNSGKTTFLKAMIQFFDQRFPIRTTEQEFELWLNNMYPHLNVMSFRASDEVSIIDAINLQKKTDAMIMILGEVASYELASAYITLTQAGTKSTLCTCHCVTTEDEIEYFRNAILSSGTFSNETMAEEQVAKSINLDIHWEKSSDGHRYISHITEIIPLPKDEAWPEDYNECLLEALKRMARRNTYITRDIVVYENGRYVFKNSLSNRSVEKICKSLSPEDKKQFLSFNNNIVGG